MAPRRHLPAGADARPGLGHGVLRPERSIRPLHDRCVARSPGTPTGRSMAQARRQHAVALVTRCALQGQRDQVPEAALRQGVPVREEAVVGVQADVWSVLHRLREQVRTEPARQRGGDGLLEEQPHVSATPGARSLERGGKAEASAAAHESDCISFPSSLVEIDGQEVAGLVEQHRIDADDKRLITRVSPGQMPSNDIVGDREETAVRTHRALDPGLLADALHPLVRAGGRIAGPAGFPAFESPRVDVFAAAEQRPEEGYLGRCRRMLAECLSARVWQRRMRLAARHGHPACFDLPKGLRRAF